MGGTAGTALPRSLRVLVVGAGAREHALALRLRQSPSVGEVWAAPGNPGIARVATLLSFGAADDAALVDWAAGHADLVVVGPEAPIARGLSDALRARGVPVFGPSRAAGELEWSKAFAKRFMAEHDIPTAAFVDFDELDPALRHVAERDLPAVVKADGLAAGKGVWVCTDRDAAEAAVRAAFALGGEGARVVVEEWLAGREASVTALVDGERFALLPVARDHKRLGEGDTGPNTGGMGAFAPVEEVDAAALGEVAERVVRPVVEGMRAIGRPYVGALYPGLMLTADGPKVLEFNCRFGDPETQVLMPLLDGDLGQLLLGCAEGRLDPAAVRPRGGAAACVVLAAAGYPDAPERGAAISGIDAAEAAGATVLHAGTALRDGELVVDGGRVLSLVAEGATVPEAAGRALAAAELVRFAGRQLRRDVGRSA